MKTGASTSPTPLQSPLPRIAVFIWLSLLVAIAAMIRIEGASDYYYNPDEVLHSSIASLPTLKEVWRYAHHETHPPLLYIICHYWIALIHSTAPSAVRCVPLFFGLLLIPTYYVIGKRLNGEMTGMCCAVIAAFSYGCIIQSYLVRHYIILTFFLSWSLYWYLRWRDGRGNVALWYYALFSMLACLSHFSGILAIPCFVMHEGIELWGRRLRLREEAKWLLANALVLGLGLGVMYDWEPVLKLMRPYFPIPALGMRMALTLAYPVEVSTQVFPTYTAPIAVMGMLLAPVLRSRLHDERPNGLNSMLALAWIALGLGMVLVVTRVYVYPGSRHCLWIFPFLVPAIGWVLGSACDWVSRILGRKIALPWKQMLILFMLAGGWCTYSAKERLLNTSEYNITQRQWQAVAAFLASMKATDIIVGERDDGNLLANLYPYEGNAAFSNVPASARVPYHDSHILFSPFYRRVVGDQMENMLKDARQRHFFDGIRRLVFIRTGWSSPAMATLMHCPTLKGATFFPTEDVPRSAGGVRLMLLPADVFFRDMLAPEGPAHDCLVPPLKRK